MQIEKVLWVQKSSLQEVTGKSVQLRHKTCQYWSIKSRVDIFQLVHAHLSEYLREKCKCLSWTWLADKTQLWNKSQNIVHWRLKKCCFKALGFISLSMHHETYSDLPPAYYLDLHQFKRTPITKIPNIENVGSEYRSQLSTFATVRALVADHQAGVGIPGNIVFTQ